MGLSCLQKGTNGRCLHTKKGKLVNNNNNQAKKEGKRQERGQLTKKKGKVTWSNPAQTSASTYWGKNCLKLNLIAFKDSNGRLKATEQFERTNSIFSTPPKRQQIW